MSETLPTVKPLPPLTQSAMRTAMLDQIEREQQGSVQRRTGLRWRLAAGAGVAAAAVAVTIGLNVVAVSPAQAWSALPDRLSGSELDAARTDCLNQANRLPIALPGAGMSVIGEKRGTTSSVLLADDQAAAICIGSSSSRFGGVTSLEPIPAGTTLTVDEAKAGRTYGPDATRFVHGRISDEVTKVVVTTSDGLVVTASQIDGHFLAWWPSGANATTVAAYGTGDSVLSVVHPDPVGSATTASEAPPTS